MILCTDNFLVCRCITRERGFVLVVFDMCVSVPCKLFDVLVFFEFVCFACTYRTQSLFGVIYRNIYLINLILDCQDRERNTYFLSSYIVCTKSSQRCCTWLFVYVI